MVKHPAHWDGLLTERSKKFYDGTFRWDGTDGFWDEGGVYHDFLDRNDPDGYPPTPRPVSPASGPVAELEALNAHQTEMLDLFRVPVTPADPLPVDISIPHAAVQKILFGYSVQRSGGKVTDVTLADATPLKEALQREHLLIGYPDRERLRGRLEGIVAERLKQETGLGLSLEECYALCGIEGRDAILIAVEAEAKKKALARPVDASNGDRYKKEPKEEEKGIGLEQKVDDVDSDSDSLSDYPSDLSDEEIPDQVRTIARIARSRKLKKLMDDGPVEELESCKKPKTKAKRLSTGRNRSGIDSGLNNLYLRRSIRNLK